MKSRLRTLALPLLLGLGVIPLWSGCDSDDNGMSIAPGEVSLLPGQGQVFTASGGADYVWALNPEDGTGELDRRSGDTVTFTLRHNPSAIASNGLNSVVEVICWSTRPDNSGRRVNTDTASAYVFIRGAEGAASAATTNATPEGTNGTIIINIH